METDPDVYCSLAARLGGSGSAEASIAVADHIKTSKVAMTARLRIVILPPSEHLVAAVPRALEASFSSSADVLFPFINKACIGVNTNLATELRRVWTFVEQVAMSCGHNKGVAVGRPLKSHTDSTLRQGRSFIGDPAEVGPPDASEEAAALVPEACFAPVVGGELPDVPEEPHCVLGAEDGSAVALALSAAVQRFAPVEEDELPDVPEEPHCVLEAEDDSAVALAPSAAVQHSAPVEEDGLPDAREEPHCVLVAQDDSAVALVPSAAVQHSAPVEKDEQQAAVQVLHCVPEVPGDFVETPAVFAAEGRFALHPEAAELVCSRYFLLGHYSLALFPCLARSFRRRVDYYLVDCYSVAELSGRCLPVAAPYC